MRISDWSSDVCSSDLASVLQERLKPLLQGRTPSPRASTSWQRRRRTSSLPLHSRMERRQRWMVCTRVSVRSEERRVGKDVSVRVDLGGRRIIKKKKADKTTT